MYAYAARLSVMDGRAAWSVVGRKRPRRVELRVVSGYFVIFPSRAAACNRKLGTARLGLFEDYPLPFRQRERVCIFCIRGLSIYGTKRCDIINRFRHESCRRELVRREKSAGHDVLPYPMKVAEYRTSFPADFSHKAGGRRCLPVYYFRTRAGATHAQAHSLPRWAPRLEYRDRAER